MKLTLLLAILGVTVQGLDITVEGTVSIVEDSSSVILDAATEGALNVEGESDGTARTKAKSRNAIDRGLKKVPGKPNKKKTVTPTAAPTCFPGDAIVTVEGKGHVNMKDLKIGDRVQGMGGEFQPIYSFGHKATDLPSEYVRLYTNASSVPLEVSPRHLVFLYDHRGIPAVPALLKVGDVLLGADSTRAALEIVKIDTVTKNGVFAPLTVDGTIAVNGVVASSYVFQTWYSLDEPNDYTYFLGRFKIMSHHAFSHMRHSPLRLASLGISPWFGSLADKEGRNFLSCAYAQAGTWMHSSTRDGFVVAAGTVLFYTLCGIAFFSYFIECLVGPVMGPTVIVLIILASMLAFKKQRSTNKTASGKKVKID